MRAFRIGAAMVGLLVVVSALMLLGRPNSSAVPSAVSFEPSGVHALYDLLKAQGYRVRIDSSASPKIARDETALGFITTSQESVSAFTALTDHIERGGTALCAYLDSDFAEGSKKARAMPATLTSDYSDETLTVTATASNLGSYTADLLEWMSSTPSDRTPIWMCFNTPFAYTARYGKGHGIFVADGYGATNRFLTSNQNAEFWIRSVAALTPKGGQVVFVDAIARGASAPGFLDVVGPWAKPVQTQLVIIFLIFAYSKSRRLGIPSEDAYHQVGQRELVDALASTYNRSKATHVALRAILRAGERRLRQVFKLSTDAPIEKLHENLSVDMVNRMHRLEVMAADQSAPDLVMATVKSFESEVDQLSSRKKRTKGR